jgi:hypothetical protein
LYQSIEQILGGHLRPDLYGKIPKYIDRYGLEDGAELAKYEIRHLQVLKKLIRDQNIDCDFTLTRTCDVWTNQEKAEEARETYQMMVGHGLSYMDDVHFTFGKAAEGVSLAFTIENSCLQLNSCRVSKVPKLALLILLAQFGPTSLSCTSCLRPYTRAP